VEVFESRGYCRINYIRPFFSTFFPMMQAAGGPRSKNPDTKLLNKIDSPGTKMRIEDKEVGGGYDHR
jgi:hypothetical protein